MDFEGFRTERMLRLEITKRGKEVDDLGDEQVEEGGATAMGFRFRSSSGYGGGSRSTQSRFHRRPAGRRISLVRFARTEGWGGERDQQRRKPPRQKYRNQNTEIVEFERKKDWHGLLDYTEGKSAGFNDVNWATTFSKLRRFRREARDITRDPRFRSLVAGLEWRIKKGDFGTQAIANIVHALGIMGARSDAFVHYIKDEAEWIAAEAEPQAISNICYALAKLREKEAARWFEEVERESVVQKLVQEGNPQEISNTVWAMATMGVKARNLASAVDSKDVVQKLVQDGNPQEISNTIWAMATMGAEARNLASVIDRKDIAQKLVQEGKPQNITNTIWAMATMGAEARNLASVVDRKDVVQKIVQEGKPQGISNTIWAMSTMKVECPGLVNGIKGDAERIIQNGNSQDVANIAYALADLGYFEKRVFNAVAGQAEREAREGKEQGTRQVRLLVFEVCPRLRGSQRKGGRTGRGSGWGNDGQGPRTFAC